MPLLSHKKPEPIIPQHQPNICPVCGKASYSAAGIHPQCAVKQADDKRQQVLKREKSEHPTKPPKKNQSPGRWQKLCPECKLSQHVRKKVCTCGHVFAKTRPEAEPR
jgi:hypothetical protein